MSELNIPRPSSSHDPEPLVRGERLTSLIASAPFTEVIFLLLRGDRSSEAERAMLDALLVACCDHGAAPPSTTTARVSASTGNALHVAAAAGFLAMGPKHGCAIADAMQCFAASTDPVALVREVLAAGRRLPGFGHKVYTDHDPRATALCSRAAELGFHGAYVDRARAIERALADAKGTHLPLNIDGAVAALLLEIRMPLAAGNAIFLIGRLPGLVAHALAAADDPSYLRASSGTT